MFSIIFSRWQQQCSLLLSVLRVSWTAKKTNQWVLNTAGVKRELLDTVKARMLACYGHTMRKEGSCLEKELMEGTVPGVRRRGRPHTAWMDNIKTWTGLPVEESIRMTEINGESTSIVWPTLGSRTAKEQTGFVRSIRSSFWCGNICSLWLTGGSTDGEAKCSVYVHMVVVVRGAATDLGRAVLIDGDESQRWTERKTATDAATESAAAAAGGSTTGRSTTIYLFASFNHLSLPSVLWCCWLGSRKGIRPVKTEWWGVDLVICLEWGADWHMAQPMPLPHTVSFFSKIQIVFTLLVLADPGSARQRDVKCARMSVMCKIMCMHNRVIPLSLVVTKAVSSAARVPLRSC